MTPSLFQDYFPNIDAAREQIRELYRRDDDRAFYVSFSGGKDSSLLLQLVYEVARAEYNGRKIFVTYNDTGVEERAAVEQLKNDAELIAATGKEINLSFQRCLPVPKYRFFATLIGCGYPTPSFSLRWCTKSLKVYPYSRFISATCKDFGGGIFSTGGEKPNRTTGNASLRSSTRPKGFTSSAKTRPSSAIRRLRTSRPSPRLNTSIGSKRSHSGRTSPRSALSTITKTTSAGGSVAGVARFAETRN